MSDFFCIFDHHQKGKIMNWTKNDIQVFRKRQDKLRQKADHLLDSGYSWLPVYRKYWMLIDELSRRIREYYRNLSWHNGLFTQNEAAKKLRGL